MRVISLRVRWWKQGSPLISGMTSRGKLSGTIVVKELVDRPDIDERERDSIATWRVILSELVVIIYYSIHLLPFIVRYS